LWVSGQGYHAMSAFLPTLLNWLQAYGYVALWLTIFVAAVGIPLPIALLLLAAGAFASAGDFNVGVLAFIALSAFVSGDTLGFIIGRRWGSKLLDWLEHSSKRRLISPQAIARSRAFFARHGGWAIFLSRFLFSGLGGIINVLAGADHYPYQRFLLWDISGEILGVMFPLLLGYVFSAGWEAIGDLLGGTSMFLLILLGIMVLSLYVLKLVRHARSSNRNNAPEQENVPAVTISAARQPITKLGKSSQRTGKLPP
jgi:membrane-associated protein